MTSFALDLGLNQLHQFHFIRPEWLWALPILVLIWLLLTRLGHSTHWESFIAKDKLEALRMSGGRYSHTWKWLLATSWTLGCLAAAGPTWKQVPVPTLRDESAMVIVMDLSRSMLAQDIVPDRLTRTRFKLIDILRLRGDGQTALVAYAGDPHTVSPLTDDPRTIEALLDALHPTIMPVQGSNTEAAIELAIQLLRDAGLNHGEILLLTDGVEPDAQKYIQNLYDGSFRLSILGIGSIDAVPIPQQGGGFFTDSKGEIILTKLNRDELQTLSGLSGGRYVELQADDSDIRYLLQDEFTLSEQPEENTLLYDRWEDMGYWLVLLILPLAAFSFRKGTVFSLPFGYLLLGPMLLAPQDAQALSWADLWQTKDQQAAKLLRENKPEEAAARFERQDWAGVAAFQAGDYQSAAEHFAGQSDIQSLYNRGNALAFQGDLEAAMAAYEQVLDQQPDHADAKHNKAVIEQLLQQQEQQNQQGESGENQDQNQNQEQQSQDSDQSENAQQQNQGSQDQEPQSQNSEPEQSQSENATPKDTENQSSQQSSDEPQSEQEEQRQQMDQQNADQPESEELLQQNSQQTDEQQQEQHTSEQEASMQMAPAEATPDSLEDSSEQWLRAIPDDPSGLLRRKFDYESRQNKLEQRYLLQLPSNPDEERY